MQPTSETLKRLERRIWAVLTIRDGVRWCTGICFGLGAIVLAVRMLGQGPRHHLIYGLLVFLPVAALVALRQWRRRPAPDQLRSLLDRHNAAGGLIVAEGQFDMGSWNSRLPLLDIPEFRWRSRRSLTVFLSSVIFLTITFAIPERHLAYPVRATLDIGDLVEEVRAEIELLEEEKLVDENRAEDLTDQLNRMERNADANDPAKTWEAIDHLKQANRDTADEAAQEAIRKIEALKQAEALGGALGMMPEPNEAGEARGMQDLAAMLKQARLEEGLLNGALPEELLKLAENARLTPEQLKQLLEAIRANKNQIGDSVAKLAALKMIDAKTLGNCKSAGQCPNPTALAEFLAKECNGTNSACAAVLALCRGGTSRGRGDAPMSWRDPSTFDGTSLKDQALPTGRLDGIERARFVGISRSTPEVTGVEVGTSAGALNASRASGGSAQVRPVLPRHKGAVRRFFQREP